MARPSTSMVHIRFSTRPAAASCRNGARGLILTQPIHAQPPTLPAGVAASSGSTAGGADAPLRHHLGGPVGMPGMQCRVAPASSLRTVLACFAAGRPVGGSVLRAVGPNR